MSKLPFVFVDKGIVIMCYVPMCFTRFNLLTVLWKDLLLTHIRMTILQNVI